MTLYEIARRVPEERPEDADACPTCLWYDAMAQQAIQDPEGLNYSLRTDVKILRRRHAESGECLAPGGARG
ncbi:hypothetical protein [Kitasatospora sp. NPDC056184]|uniref:hypothetical protein n=1 Tax=Kitasatospora sp. NPDC056184 TaxID=3345738 RepID=UPI0035D64B10